MSGCIDFPCLPHAPQLIQRERAGVFATFLQVIEWLALGNNRRFTPRTAKGLSSLGLVNDNALSTVGATDGVFHFCLGPYQFDPPLQTALLPALLMANKSAYITTKEHEQNQNKVKATASLRSRDTDTEYTCEPRDRPRYLVRVSRRPRKPVMLLRLTGNCVAPVTASQPAGGSMKEPPRIIR